MLVIHVGLRKAGSTTIQKFLSANEDALREMGIDYPRVGRGNRLDHNNLARELLGRPNFDAKYGTLAQLSTHLSGLGGKVSVISAESLEVCEIADIRRLKKTLHLKNKHVTILMIIRDLVDLIPSSYAQQIKHGSNQKNFDEFFSEKIEKKSTNHFEVAQSWATVFGWHQIKVRVLDPRQLEHGDLIDDFLTILGLDPSDARVAAMQRSGASNISPGWRVLEALRAIYSGHHSLPVDHPLATFAPSRINLRIRLGDKATELGERWGWNEDRGQYFTREMAQRCLDLDRRAIGSLNEVLPNRLPEPVDLDARGFVDRKFLPDSTRIDRKRLDAFYNKLGKIGVKKRKAPDTSVSSECGEAEDDGADDFQIAPNENPALLDYRERAA